MIRNSATFASRLCSVIVLCLTIVFCGALAPETAFSQALDNGRNNTKAGPAERTKAPRSQEEKGSDQDSGSTKDQVVNDDHIVVGSQCVGQDCVNGHNFGFDTIVLKENNLRIKFEDTSVSASFPKNKWQIRINDSSNGGGSYFAVEDVTGGRTPFRVDAGAPSDALRVDSQGDVGIGTANPVLEIHTADGDTPSLRLEQNGTSGWSPQTWDLAGNETNFFVRDVTNGSKLPFRIRPDAPSNSIYVTPTGHIGLGTASPLGKLHLIEGAVGSPGATLLYDDLIMETDEPLGGISVLSENTAVAGMFFGDPESGIAGGVQYSHGSDQLTFWAGGTPKMNIKGNGDVEVPLGTVVHPSDRRLKKNIQPIAGALSIVRSLEGVRFQWKDENRDRGVEVGLIAQDVEQWLPEVVVTSDDEMATKMISYSNIVAVLIEAIKDQQTVIEAQREALSALEVKFGGLQSSVSRLLEAEANANVVGDRAEPGNIGAGR